MNPALTTVFFPGLGADSSLARFHPVTDGDVVWIEWPDPIPEDWGGFVEAIRRQIPAGRELRYVGISFGGLAALATARVQPPGGGVHLIGSLVDRSELMPLFRALLGVVSWIPEPLFDLRLVPDFLVRHFFGIRDPGHLALFRAMAARLPAKSVKSLCKLIGAWVAPEAMVDVHRVHGVADRIIRAPSRNGLLLDGGHLISMTHAEEINRWLADSLSIPR